MFEAEERARRGDVVDLRFVCSSGTYVRSLVADLGDAYCLELRRTAIGPFAVSGSAVHGTPETGIPLGEALARFLPVVELDGPAAEQAAHGVAVAAPAPATEGDTAGTRVLLRDADGSIALAERRAGGLLKPVVGFRS